MPEIFSDSARGNFPKNHDELSARLKSVERCINNDENLREVNVEFCDTPTTFTTRTASGDSITKATCACFAAGGNILSPTTGSATLRQAAAVFPSTSGRSIVVLVKKNCNKKGYNERF